MVAHPIPLPLAPPYPLPAPGVVEYMGRRCNATWYTQKKGNAEVLGAPFGESYITESHVCCEPLGHHRADPPTDHLCKGCDEKLPSDVELRGP